jgi:hypothetical protein
MRVLAAVGRFLLLPVRFVWWIVTRVGRLLGAVARPLITRFDASPRLSVMIDSLSSAMATQRGLPLLIGTVLLFVSWIAHAVVLAILVSSNTFDSQLYLLCIPFTILHVGLLAGFIGMMVATPLGQGYKDK